MQFFTSSRVIPFFTVLSAVVFLCSCRTSGHQKTTATTTDQHHTSVYHISSRDQENSLPFPQQTLQTGEFDPKDLYHTYKQNRDIKKIRDHAAPSDIILIEGLREVIPNNRKVFERKDIFQTFPAKGGKKEIKYNKETCPRFYCATAEDWLMRAPDGHFLIYRKDNDEDVFELFNYGYDQKRLRKGDLIGKSKIDFYGRLIFPDNEIMSIDDKGFCMKPKFFTYLGLDDWIKAIVDPEEHSILLEVKPNDTGKCRVVTLVLDASIGQTDDERYPLYNNAIRIFQRAN